jgi:hypothetical protein
MVWSLADERFKENLQAPKGYYEEHWTLCASRYATMLDRPVAQWLSSLRHPTRSTTTPSRRRRWRPWTRFLSNMKSRRAKLTADKLQALADLGLEWAAA